MEERPNRLYKVVLTGGPCGGKTTGQSRLCTFFENLGWKVFRVPETATVLLSGGIKFSDLTAEEERELSCTLCLAKCAGHGNNGVAFKFQENLLRTMIQIEDTFFALGETCKRNCLIICDRGAMDASAFISREKWELMMEANKWNSVELRDTRYNQIVHMVSAANGAEDFYSLEDHACRSEGIVTARELDYNAAAAWVGHPYFDVFDNSTDFEAKICRMIEAVCQKLGIDTGDRLLTTSRKLKFLVDGPLPDDSEFPPFQDFDVIHHYLQTNNSRMQARLRKRGQLGHYSYIHTIRKPKIRDQVVEVKTQLTHRDYCNMLDQQDDLHYIIYKKRRCFLVNNQYFQLDIYKPPCHPRCQGLLLLETYSSADESNLQKSLPKFLKIKQEVTGNPDYSMFNLSLREEWTRERKGDKFCHSLKVEPEENCSTCDSVVSKSVRGTSVSKENLNCERTRDVKDFQGPGNVMDDKPAKVNGHTSENGLIREDTTKTNGLLESVNLVEGVPVKINGQESESNLIGGTTKINGLEGPIGSIAEESTKINGHVSPSSLLEEVTTKVNGLPGPNVLIESGSARFNGQESKSSLNKGGAAKVNGVLNRKTVT